MGQQVLQGVQNALPGLIPNSSPGCPRASSSRSSRTSRGTPSSRRRRWWTSSLRDELLDIFGHESNFTNQVQNCFVPGMGIVMQRPNAPEVDLLISLSCNQAKMDGAPWPHPVNGFTPDTRNQLGADLPEALGPRSSRRVIPRAPGRRRRSALPLPVMVGADPPS